jgi:serine protease Do
MGTGKEKTTVSRIRARLLSTGLALALAAGAGFAGYSQAYGQQTPARQTQLPTPGDLSRTFVQVAKQVKPAVVSIDVVERARRTSRSTGRLPEGFPQIPGFPSPDNSPRRGTGSGVIISPDGYILTNNHVVGDADQINVKLADGRELKARRVGTDPDTDLAVIKVDVQGLPFAKIGNSDIVEQGEWVIALGSPFGLQHTMTAGIISATGRDIPGAGQFTNFIQTDASINPGNSGGPLINMEGEIIGINTLIYSRSGGSQGIGFAIPANLANKVYAQLVKSGRVTRGYLGVTLGEITPAIAQAVGYDGKQGVLVNDLARNDSPAAKAGLRSGDVIVEFDGKTVTSPKQLTEMVVDTPVGKTVPVKYVRDGRVLSATIMLGERPQANAPDREENFEEEGSFKLGITTQNVTPEIAREQKLKIGTGVIIRNVQPGSPAAEAGLQAGDVIHRINRIPVQNSRDLAEAMRVLKNQREVVIQVENQGQLRFVTVTIE